MGRNIASPLQLSSFNNAVRRQITSPTQLPAHMSSISENDRNFSDSVTECVEERNTIKKDRAVLSHNPTPVSHESSRPALSVNTVGNHLIDHHTRLPNLPPLLADSQPPPRTHLSLPPHPHTYDIAQANTNTYYLYQPDPIDTSCALKIKECYLPSCAFNNPVLVVPPPRDRRRRRRVCLPELVRSTSLSGQAAAAAAAALPPSMSQSYREKSYCAMDKDKDKESVHFSWGPGRMDVPKRRQPRLFVQ